MLVNRLQSPSPTMATELAEALAPLPPELPERAAAPAGLEKMPMSEMATPAKAVHGRQPAATATAVARQMAATLGAAVELPSLPSLPLVDAVSGAATHVPLRRLKTQR